MNFKRCTKTIWLRTADKLGLIFLIVFVFIVFMCFFYYSQPQDDILVNIQKACNKDSLVTFEQEKADDINTADGIERVLTIAKKVSQHNGLVLVSVVNDAFLPFAYSWLCNTQHMNIHKSILIITTDEDSRYNLNQDWPEVNVVKLNLGIPRGNQEYSTAGYLQIMIRRTELLLKLLKADIEVLLLEFDYMWFANPIPNLQKMKGVDFLVNPVTSTSEKVYNGGFLYMFPTVHAKALWQKVTDMMYDLGKQLHQKTVRHAVSQDENDQVYFSTLVKQRFANVTIRELPLHTYADGKWYNLWESERQKQHPVVISNNFVLGNLRKIKRAKQWNHWFLHEDCTCNYDLVRKMVYR